MTVSELRDALAGFPDDARSRENASSDADFQVVISQNAVRANFLFADDPLGALATAGRVNLDRAGTTMLHCESWHDAQILNC